MGNWDCFDVPKGSENIVSTSWSAASSEVEVIIVTFEDVIDDVDVDDGIHVAVVVDDGGLT